VKLEREKNELPHLSADSEFYAHPHKLGIWGESLCGCLNDILVQYFRQYLIL
jgi:hypothetical protein